MITLLPFKLFLFEWMQMKENKQLSFDLNVTTLTIYNLKNENNEHLIFGSHEIKYRHSFLMIDIFWHETWCCTYYIRPIKWKSKCEVLTSNDNCHIIPCVSSWMILRYLYLKPLDFGIIVNFAIAEYKCSSAFLHAERVKENSCYRATKIIHD